MLYRFALLFSPLLRPALSLLNPPQKLYLIFVCFDFDVCILGTFYTNSFSRFKKFEKNSNQTKKNSNLIFNLNILESNQNKKSK